MKMIKFMMVAATALPMMLAVPASADVEVVFSEQIEGDMDRLNQLEVRREEFFRKYRQEGSRRFRPGRADQVYFKNVKFAHEKLIPEVDDYSVQALANAMVAYNLSKIESHNPAHTLRVEIDDFNVSNYSLARYSQGPTRMKGTMSIIDANGRVVRSERVVTALLPKFSSVIRYDGEEYAYLRDMMNVRVGPMLASFLEKGMEDLYPDADVPGPIFLRRRN
ncbi:hypothetical protein [Kordiimonas aquimaris]|uniref:hypothetical protein n=1 Tax=Kordiimonas aquimaris TaxID=707591 RepID=UPI0021D249DE|nr:hypothetical protein [Kordiimonas aquimaris]